MHPWREPKDYPPLHNQVLIEIKGGPGPVYDVACYIGRQPIEGGGSEDRWILADVRLDTKQIARWQEIEPYEEESKA